MKVRIENTGTKAIRLFASHELGHRCSAYDLMPGESIEIDVQSMSVSVATGGARDPFAAAPDWNELKVKP